MLVRDIVLFFGSQYESNLFVLISSESAKKFLVGTYLLKDVISRYGNLTSDDLRLTYDEKDEDHILTIYVA